MPSRVDNKTLPQRLGLPKVFNQNGSISKHYVWGMVTAPSKDVLQHRKHEPTARGNRFQFAKKNRPSAILRWLPKRHYERITANRTGWTHWEDFAVALSLPIPVKKRCSTLMHPTTTWREMMVGMSEDNKTRFEGIWFKQDLLQIGIEEHMLDTETCAQLDPMMEVTPVGVRAICGTEFQTIWNRLTLRRFLRIRLALLSTK